MRTAFPLGETSPGSAPREHVQGASVRQPAGPASGWTPLAPGGTWVLMLFHPVQSSQTCLCLVCLLLCMRTLHERDWALLLPSRLS